MVKPYHSSDIGRLRISKASPQPSGKEALKQDVEVNHVMFGAIREADSFQIIVWRS